MFDEYKKQQQLRRARRLPYRVELLKEICGSLNLQIEKKTEFQYRITNNGKSLDIYPIHYRWHDTTENKRGQIQGDKKLKELIIKKLIERN